MANISDILLRAPKITFLNYDMEKMHARTRRWKKEARRQYAKQLKTCHWFRRELDWAPFRACPINNASSRNHASKNRSFSKRVPDWMPEQLTQDCFQPQQDDLIKPALRHLVSGNLCIYDCGHGGVKKVYDWPCGRSPSPISTVQGEK